MRLRKCKVCGKDFQSEKEQRLCPACRSAARAATVVRPRECAVCGCTFDGGPRATYCPKCREERTRRANAEYQRRKAAGRVRQIGSTDICTVCGKEYVVTGSLQQYCPECAPEAVRQKVLPVKRQRASDQKEAFTAKKKKLNAESKICAYCGRPFTSNTPAVTCSEECAREHKRILRGMTDYKRGQRKTLPSAVRYDSGLPQSELVGVTYHRKTGKWQVTHEGKYIGLFSSQEEAEVKKGELQSEPPD